VDECKPLMCGLNPAGRAWFLATLALQSAAWLAFNARHQADDCVKPLRRCLV